MHASTSLVAVKTFTIGLLVVAEMAEHLFGCPSCVGGRTEVSRLHCKLRAWAMQGFVTPDQALEYLAGAEVRAPCTCEQAKACTAGRQAQHGREQHSSAGQDGVM